MRWQPIDSGVSSGELSPARPLQIGRTAGAFCNGVDHGKYKTGFPDAVLWKVAKSSSPSYSQWGQEDGKQRGLYTNYTNSHEGRREKGLGQKHGVKKMGNQKVLGQEDDDFLSLCQLVRFVKSRSSSS